MKRFFIVFYVGRSEKGAETKGNVGYRTFGDYVNQEKAMTKIKRLSKEEYGMDFHIAITNILELPERDYNEFLRKE